MLYPLGYGRPPDPALRGRIRRGMRSVNGGEHAAQATNGRSSTSPSGRLNWPPRT
jgi:hypothetical protein